MLKSLFGGNKKLTVVPQKPFEWKSGLCLEATEDSHLLFPGAILKPDETPSMVITCSHDETELGFQEKEGGGFKTISVFLKAGQALTLHRSTEAVLMAPDTRKRSMHVRKT